MVLLLWSGTNFATEQTFHPFSCYNYPIANDYFFNPALVESQQGGSAEHLWLGRISSYAIRQKRRLTFEIMIIAEQLAFKRDYPAHALEQVKSWRRIPVATGDLGSFTVYLEINPRNLAQRDNLREFIEDELQQDSSYLFASGQVSRMVTFRGQRYPLLTYSQISFGPDYKVELDPRPRLFRSDISSAADNSQQSPVICDQLRRCMNRWDQAAADSCQ